MIIRTSMAVKQHTLSSESVVLPGVGPLRCLIGLRAATMPMETSSKVILKGGRKNFR